MQDAGQAGPRAERDVIDLTREPDTGSDSDSDSLSEAGTRERAESPDYADDDADADADADDMARGRESVPGSGSRSASDPGVPPIRERDDRAILEEALAELRALKAQIDALEEDMVPEFDALRQMIRRLRFANRMTPRDAPGRTPSDTSFFDSMRRRFSQSWEDEREFLLRCEPYHLVFLANLLDFPAVRECEQMMTEP